MFRRLTLSCLALFAMLTTWRAAPAETPLNEPPLRVLVITGGHGYERQAFEEVFRSMPDVVMTTAEYPAAAQLLTPQAADKYDVLVFYDMWTKGITPAQQEAFVQLLDKGIGVVALHHTLAAHPNWPEYARIIGGQYFTRPRQEDGRTVPGSTFEHGLDMPIQIADATHPITHGLADFTIHDEAYKDYATDPQATVLLTSTHPKSDREIAWVKTYRGSRVFYLQLGHDHHAYENPNFRTLVARGIRWAAARPTQANQSP